MRSTAGGYQRWANGTPIRDFTFAYASTALATTAFYALLVVLDPAWGGYSTYISALLVVLVVVDPLVTLLSLSWRTPLRVGANADGFAFVRFRGRGQDFEGFLWDALVPGDKSTWTPYLGRKYPIQVIHSAGLPPTRLALSRQQAELLASFPQGAGLRKILD